MAEVDDAPLVKPHMVRHGRERDLYCPDCGRTLIAGVTRQGVDVLVCGLLEVRPWRAKMASGAKPGDLIACGLATDA
jgi:hypothetical protein